MANLAPAGWVPAAEEGGAEAGGEADTADEVEAKADIDGEDREEERTTGFTGLGSPGCSCGRPKKRAMKRAVERR